MRPSTALLWLSLITLFPVSPAQAGTRIPASCFYQHILDGVILSQQRAPFYSAASAGLSLPISAQVIALQQLLLPITTNLDARAHRFRERGIAFFCDEFVSMELTPSFLAHKKPRGPAPAAVLTWEWDIPTLVSTLKSSYEAGGLAQVSRQASKVLRQLDEHPDYFCMTRHLLESVRRSSNLGLEHQKTARRKQLPAPEREAMADLSWELVQLHLAGLATGATLDRLAAPLQQAGVPILCRDVPPVAAR